MRVVWIVRVFIPASVETVVSFTDDNARCCCKCKKENEEQRDYLVFHEVKVGRFGRKGVA
jgi:hypothetical protein